MKQKSILTIQDYSCLGRCSLTVAQPTISAAGIQCVGLPTAVLSNHTAYPSWTLLDCFSSLQEAPEKWGKKAPAFSYIYTGYLLTEQIGSVLDLISRLHQEEALLFVDPACADGGSLYPGFAPNHKEELKRLIRKASLIKPNLTEACLLTDTPYREEGDEEYFQTLLGKLEKLGPKQIVLSGVEKGKEIGCYYSDFGKRGSSFLPSIGGRAHGTGDLFASALVSSLALRKSLSEAALIAERYVARSLSFNLEDGVDGIFYGPEFEKAIPSFLKDLGL